MVFDITTRNVNELNNDPRVKREIATQIENGAWQRSALAPLVGKSGTRAIRRYVTEVNGVFVPSIRLPLEGTGVQGNTDFDANRSELVIGSHGIVPEVIGNSVISEIEAYRKIKNIDFKDLAIDSLTDWLNRRIDDLLYANLFNNPTNGYVFNKTFAPGKSFVDNIKESQTTGGAGTSMGPVTLAGLREALRRAKGGIAYDGGEGFPLKPALITSERVGDFQIETTSYIILLSEDQKNQLDKDPAWVEHQKSSGYGKENFNFRGIAGNIDGNWIITAPSMNAVVSGLIDSDTKPEIVASILRRTDARDIVLPSYYGAKKSFGYILGANALVYGGEALPNVYMESADIGRKIKVGIDKTVAIAKAKYISDRDNIFNNKDYGVFTLVSKKD